jgi:hypothetical protein
VIERVAEALLEYQTLDFAAVETLVANAGG